MTDDIVNRLREVHRPTVMQAQPSALCVEAAEEIERLRQLIKSTYWSARAVLENISDCVPSPNEIYGYVNELRDDISWIEKVLDIKNPMTDD